VRLFQIPFSHNCVKVRRVLDLKGIEYETVDINPAWRGNVKRASGQTLVPVLIDGDRSISGSSPILLDVEERYPDPPLLPADQQDRAECALLMDWADATFMDLTRRMAYFRVLSGDADLGTMFFPRQPPRVRRTLGKGAGLVLRQRFGISRQQNRRDVERARQAARVAADRLGTEDHLVGGRLTLADVSLAAMAAPLQYTEVASDLHVQRLLEWARGILGNDFTPRQILV
jgi:glutathione S-transferase